mgnify:CR=1 FL=1
MRCKLGDISEITKLAGYEFTKYIKYIPDGEIIAVRALNLKNGALVLDDIQRISKEVSETLPRSQLHKNDIVLSYTGTLGECAQIREDGKYHLAPNVCKITPNDSVVNPNFLFQYIRCEKFKQTLINYAHGSTQPTIPMSTIRDIPVDIPDDLEKQGKIAAILSALDEKIAINRAINDNLYEMVNAYYTSLFKDVECEMTTIDNYAERIYSGGTPATSNAAYWGGAFGWFSSGETRNRFVISTEKSITQTGIDNSSTKLAVKHDIVMASAGQGFTRGQTSMLLIDTYVNQSVIVIHADRNILPYLFWNLANRYEELRAISDSSSIRGSLTTKMIAAFEIPLANNDVIQTFSDFAWAVIPKIENNLLENERLVALRDSLLPKLMSDKIDVVAARP